MDEIFEFLQASPVQYFATVGTDGKPKVRPFQMMYRDGDRLIFCTSSEKEVYRELNACPNAELCVSDGERWLRISGCVRWLEDRAVKARVIAESPLVASIYKNADNPVLKTFYLENATATLSDFSGKPPLRAHFGTR